jgi:hypothetical protein
MYDLPEEIDLVALPDLFATHDIPAPDRIIKMHLFSNHTDWFFCEYNPAVKNLFGMVVIKNDFKNARWGYFTMPELEEISYKIMEIRWNKIFIPRAVKNLKPLIVKFNKKVRIYS